MNPSYISLIVLWIVIFTMLRNRRNAAAVKRIIEKRKAGGDAQMKELATRFINKECVIYSYDSGHQYMGVIKEVVDGAILLEKDGRLEALNLDFVIRIREYPTNKHGKKKSVILD